jgi:hypothetical protein
MVNMVNLVAIKIHMKRVTAVIFFAFISSMTVSQVKDLKPSEIAGLDLSDAGAAKFNRDREIYTKISDKLVAGTSIEELSDEERRILNETNETVESYWDIMGAECNWYCGGGPNEVTASTILKAQGENSYAATNAHDLSYKTAWVEGAPGDGVGEFLLYKFAPASPRITDIIVVNGYVKSTRAYHDNARAKKLKMYLNDEPYAILHLEDRISRQFFKVEPIGNGNRTDRKVLMLRPGWTLKFEVLEVYKGLKYDDLAITEIYFDGIDVH